MTAGATARALQDEIVKDLDALFEGTNYKTPFTLTEVELRQLLPEDEAGWTDDQRRYWAELQKDFNRHRMAAPKAYPQFLPLRETQSPEPPREPECEEEMEGEPPEPPREPGCGEEMEDEPPEPPQDPEADDDPFPYLIVRLDKGDITGPDAAHRINVIVLVGIFDDDPGNQGYIAVMEIIERIQQHYQEMPVLGAFSFTGEFSWALQDEESYPYYFGVCSFAFDAPAPRITQWEDLT